ncbi:MAG: PD40 domain-containing protein [Bacteroidetes bacterium]|nr:PD40 domain-containing protein [Bacteroidota bacterium]
MAENGEGNLQDAISIYEKIVADENAEISVKAKAQLHIGLCYEKLGKTEAIKAYELVLQNYQNYKDEVQVASLRLSELRIEEEDEGLTMINLYAKGSDIAEGTMLDNSSLSPDGTKLVGIDYSIGQNVAVYDLRTNQIQLVTKYEWTNENDGWTYFPVWSPDGKEVVFMYSGWTENSHEIKVSNLEGKSHTIFTNEPNAGQLIPRQWSVDGNNILTYIQDSSGFYTIALVSATDGSVTPLYKTQWDEKFIKGDASLSPDGKFVVFADGPKDNLDIFIINTDGGSASKLSSYPTNEYKPLWSPDGTHIVFVKETKGESLLYALEMKEGKSSGQLFLIKEGMQNIDLVNWTEGGVCCVMSLDLHDIHTLPLDPETGLPTGNPEPLDYTPTGSNTNPVWSHDGKYLAFLSYGESPKVVIKPLDGGEIRYYPILAPGFWELSLWDLHWLPDNSGIGFNIMNPMDKAVAYKLDLSSGKWQDWILPLDGWTRTDWGPDKNSLIYTDNNMSAPGLYQFNLKTNETKNIFQVEEAEWYVFRNLKFSRDHKKIVFFLNDAKIILYDFETGEGGLFVEKYYAPTFSPDGKKILTSSKSGMTILSLEGKILNQYDLKQHFSAGTRIGSFDWSPDGKQLVFMTRNLLFETYLMKNVLK